MMVQYLIKKLYQLARCPLHVYNSDGSEFDAMVPKGFYDPLSRDAGLRGSLTDSIKRADNLLIPTAQNPYGGLILPSGTAVILGPLFDKPLSKELTQERLRAVGILLKSVSWSVMRIYPENEPFDKEQIRDLMEEASRKFKTPPMERILPTETPHNTHGYELAHLDAVTQGEPEMAVRYKKAPMHGKTGFLGLDAMRDARNNTLINIVLAARAAILGGISVETAYTMADFYIIANEMADNIQDVEKLSLYTSYAFAKLVQEDMKRRQKPFSRLVTLMIDEIKRNLYKPVRSGEIAAAVEKNVDYAERLFKKETGLSIMDFLRKERIKVACDLLSHSELKIKDIADTLTFTSTSHFARVFKAQLNLSPLEYRTQNAARAADPQVLPKTTDA